MNYNLSELALVPKEFLEGIKDDLSQIKQAQNSQNHQLPDYISEKDAKPFIGRKTTWFFEMRRSGQLPFSKAGSKVFYSRADLLNLIERK